MQRIRRSLIIFSTFLLLLVGIGCNNQTAENPTDSHHNESTNSLSGDLRETTANTKELPSFLKDYDPHVTKAYQIAVSHASLLDWIPCYCGCGESASHKNNRDCFIYEIKKDGKVVWDDHGTRCGTCMNIAVESALLKEKGKSDLEIRKYIDEKYQKGYAPPTPTPMPS